MAATLKTTVKPIALGYRTVGATSGEYTKCMGVLKGLAIAQDDPDETTVDAEFYDSPFDIIYTGKPIRLTFDLVNYKLSDLPALFGGTYKAADASNDESYEGAAAAFTSEHEWKLDFQKGNTSLIIYRGKTMGNLKKDADGALGYSVTISSLVYTDSDSNDHMYKIIGDPKTGG